MARTELFVRKQPGGMFAVEDVAEHPGDIFFVHSGTGTDGAGYGKNPDAPVATLDYAIGLCTANKNDVIYVLPGHSETYSTTGTKNTFDIAGVMVIGLGGGADRPTFTFSHTGATQSLSANGVTLRNLLWVTGTDSVTTLLTISGADCTLEDIESRDTTDVEVIDDVITTAAADRLTVRRFFKNGYTSGDANARVFKLVGTDRALFENCRFITKVTTAVINFATTACTGIVVRHCTFLVDSTTDYSKTIVNTIGGGSWSADDCFDIGAGASFSGGSGAALAGDDVSAVSAGVSTVNSIATTTSAGVSTNTSRLTAASTMLNTISTAISTVNSIDTTVSAGVSTVDSIVTTASTGVSTNTSRLTAASTMLNTISTAVSTVDSIVTTASAGVSTVNSIATTASAGVSTVNSIVTTVSTGVNTVSTAVSTADSKIDAWGGQHLQQDSWTDATPLSSGTMFTYTGAIEILYLIGTVTTVIQGQATTVQLYINPDALGNYNITDALGDINAAAAGTLLQITGTAANSVTITAGGALAPRSQANPIVATSRTNGVIGVTYGAASTGAIRWDLCWRPISPGATVTPS